VCAVICCEVVGQNKSSYSQPEWPLRRPLSKARPMCTKAIIAIAAAVLVSNSAVAKVKRIEFIPESIRGSWVPSTEVCEKAAKSMITVSATNYTSSDGNCMVVWVSETSAARGPMYAAHLQCSKPEDKARKAQSDVMFYPKDDKQISIGPRFSEFKDYQRCSASEPASTR
jgi:hypothetical protein